MPRRRGARRFAQASLALPFAVAASAAEPPPLVTDRPDQTESPFVVPRRSLQVETGWVFSRDDAAGTSTQTHQFLGTLVRYGLLAKLELRGAWTGWIRQRESGPGPDVEVDGAGDASIGAKLHLAEERSRRPQLALIAGTFLPAGANEVSSDGFDPALRLTASHTLTEHLGLGYNLGLAWETVDTATGEDTLSRYVYTTALGIGISERVSTFVELFGDVPASDGGGPANSADGGVTYLLRDNIQLDASAGVGLSDDADDWFVSVGASLRWPE